MEETGVRGTGPEPGRGSSVTRKWRRMMAAAEGAAAERARLEQSSGLFVTVVTRKPDAATL